MECRPHRCEVYGRRGSRPLRDPSSPWFRGHEGLLPLVLSLLGLPGSDPRLAWIRWVAFSVCSLCSPSTVLALPRNRLSLARGVYRDRALVVGRPDRAWQSARAAFRIRRAFDGGSLAELRLVHGHWLRRRA